MVQEIKEHLQTVIIPFWKALRDDEYGGYYGLVTDQLEVDKKAIKGCILNSRITWFFANAYLILRDASLLEEARHGYEFLRDYCLDRESGGIYWSMTYDGQTEDTTKHTYNQAFSIYALSTYYDASKDEEALEIALSLFRLIEDKCTDEIGYLEAFDRDFHVVDNDKLSENGVMADKTMNTLLHVLEAYTELYRVSGNADVKKRLLWIMDTFAEKIYNSDLHRLEVFFDRYYNPILDLHSYGHDIETAWLLDRTVEVLKESKYEEVIYPMTADLTAQIYKVAFNGHALANECECGKVDDHRVWWVQAETIVGFINGYEKHADQSEYLEAAKATWEYVKKYFVDPREGSEWFGDLTPEGVPYENRDIVEPWKCPYHNGRMCMEVIRRAQVLD